MTLEAPRPSQDTRFAPLVVQEKAEIVVVTPVRRMVFAMMASFNPRTAIAATLESPAAIEHTNPGTMRKTLELAEEFPTELDPENLVMERAISLAEMRERYPSVIGYFDDTKVQEALNKHPEMQERLLARMARLQSVGGGSAKQIEVLLNILRADGTISGITDDDYIRVAASHEVYGDLMEIMTENAVLKTQREEADVTEIGQKLLKLRRLYELNPDVPQKDTGDEASKKRTPQQDFYARQVQGRLMKRMTVAILAEGEVKGNAAKVSYYKGLSQQQLGEQMLREHPDRWNEISEEFPALADGPRGQSRWVKGPGAPDIDRPDNDER